MPDDSTPSTAGSAEEKEADFQKRFTWDEPDGDGADKKGRRQVALDIAPKRQVVAERGDEERVACKATWDGLAAGERYRRHERDEEDPDPHDEA